MRFPSALFSLGMENLRLDLMESADTMEEDEFYEEIEAPKFVDFTAPDRSRPDGRSWFCVRVGERTYLLESPILFVD